MENFIFCTVITLDKFLDFNIYWLCFDAPNPTNILKGVTLDDAHSKTKCFETLQSNYQYRNLWVHETVAKYRQVELPNLLQIFLTLTKRVFLSLHVPVVFGWWTAYS